MTRCATHCLIAALAALLAAGCSKPPSAVLMANPASVHCVQRGGKLVMVKDAAGEKGMCHLPDGTVVEEWALFRRDQPRR